MRISDKDLKKLLLASNKVKMDVLEEAARSATQSGQPLLQVILKKNLIDERNLTEMYGEAVGAPYVNLAEAKVPRDILVKVPEHIAVKYQAVLFGKDNGTYKLAMADPEDLMALDFLKKQINSPVRVYTAIPSDILAVLDQYKGSIEGEITKAIKASADEEGPAEPAIPAGAEKDLGEDAPIAKTINIILEYAIKSRASDVHIEPRENIIQVRCRVDGVLQESMTLPRQLMGAVVSRIKILANLKIDEHRIPQDGRFKYAVGGKTVALRVSTLPIMDGEKVVMRILDESTKPMTLEELGFEGRGLEVIRRGLSKPHGMTLVTGPTGSGKSTTLYSVLNLINSPGVNISTVEDPVEYRVSGVNQTQVNAQVGMTFANGLRALLRQDPNIIMVGEIRDKETAELAVQAALTGHVVLSTLHTNNAATSLPRLLEMGIEPFLIASTINTVVGQRLVRQVCPNCRVPYVPAGQEVADLQKDFQVDAAVKYFESTQQKAQIPAAPKAEEPADGPHGKVVAPPADIDNSIIEKIKSDPNIINRTAAQAAAAVATQTVKVPTNLAPGQFLLYKSGPGCKDCTAGYRGRMGIYEVLEVSEPIGKLIVSHATSEEIQVQAIKEGMLTMQQDGFVKALRGLTTIEEVLRVTRE